MDFSNASCEIIESLEYLRPPVKRIPNKIWKDKNININSFVQIHGDKIRSLHKHSPKDVLYTKVKYPVTSSTSLIENKYFDRQILEKYSSVSYTTLLHPTYRRDYLQKSSHEVKPLIKVIVIPKTQQSSRSRLRRKSGQNTKEVHKTASSHENSIEPNKLFLVLTGEKEKIYEIKPSESSQLSCELVHSKLIDENNVIKSIASIKELIKSLDMDKKKSKNNKINTNKCFDIDGIGETDNFFRECKCEEFSTFGIKQNAYAQPSRVRISGHVAVTENEKYVLNCTASVDNKPITTISKSIKNNSPEDFTSNYKQPKYNQHDKICNCVTGCNNVNILMKKQKDSNIQVDLDYVNYYSENVMQNAFRSKKSQSSQVDRSIQLPNTDSLRTREKNTLHKTSILEKGAEENTLRTYHSPLVIISVYPKQDTSQITNIQNKSMEDSLHPQWPEKLLSSENSKRPYKKQINNIKNNLDSPRLSRSPSPVKNCCNQRNKNNNKFNTRITQTTRRKGSPPRNFNSVINKVTQNKDKMKQQTKAINKVDTCTMQNTKGMNCPLKSCEAKNIQAQLKKSLVEDYTEMLTRNIDKDRDINGTKNENSRVNIKIDGDNENYYLLSNQRKLKTDLRIRKTVNGLEAQKYGNVGHENNKFSLVSSTEPTRRKESPVKQVNQSSGFLDYQKRTSTLRPRDSIEIFHRRETSHHVKDTVNHKSTNENECSQNATKYLAPVKHYRGDNCEVPNPIERDKQIRELLGIIKGIPTISKEEHKLGSVSEDQSMIECFYKKSCNKNFESGVSRYNFYSCCCIHENNKQGNRIVDNESETSQKKIGYESSIDETSISKPLILNRNIQIFLQIEQFSKRRPIILSRKQYNKVKKIIQKTTAKKVGQDKRKNSIVSIGEVRQRTKPAGTVEYEYAKCTQTKDSVPIFNEIKTDRKRNSIRNYGKCFEQRQIRSIVLIDSKNSDHSNIDAANKAINSEKRTVSSLEIRFTNVAYINGDTFSSTNVESLSSTSFNQRNNSHYTLFKVHRKTPTPNLGTSVFSLLTSSTKLKSKCLESSSSTPNIKVKKPFLRRLMSCLVMQSGIPEKKTPKNPTPKLPSANNSVDSYHINTSLDAIEITSSVYDTSASFYSEHDVCPVVNNRMKRGFFSSVRGFLTNHI